MSNRFRVAALTGGVVLALALPVAAQAATQTVYAGPPQAVFKKLHPPAALNQIADVNAFFPNKITIHRGDKVRFTVLGFHTVNFPAHGSPAAELISPTGNKISGQNDALGQAFWFNGQDELGFNPALFRSEFGKTVTYNGRNSVESGLPTGEGNIPPLTVKFTKKGTFTYYCNVHPGMKAQVKVVAARAKAPTKKAIAKTVVNQAKKAIKLATRLLHTTVPAGVVEVGPAAPGGVELFKFAPSSLTIPVGTTLRFQMPSASRDDHTATTGPGDPEREPNSYLGQLAGSFQSPQIAQAAIYPSDPPGAPASLTPSWHGNGFWNSGVLDTSSATPLPNNNSVRFNAAGTYTFYCLIHPFMKATITVK